MNGYRLSADADDDLSRVFDYGIDQFGIEQALKYKGARAAGERADFSNRSIAHP